MSSDRIRSPALPTVAWAVAAAAALAAGPADAAIVTVSGVITQSVADGTGPAVANPSLNAVEDGQAFFFTVDLGQAWAGAGRYSLPGTAVSWQVPAAGAGETGFGSATLVIEDIGSAFRFSLLACLPGGDCAAGNALSALFEVPLDGVTSADAPAIGLDQPHPMQLLADDGVTDLHGRIDRYGLLAGPTTPVPTPGTVPLVALALGAAAFARWLRRARRPARVSFLSRRISPCP